MHDDDLDRVIERAQQLLEEIETEADGSLRQTVFELLQHVDTIHREGLSRLAGMLRAVGQRGLLEKAGEDKAVGVLLDLYGMREDRRPPQPPGAAEGTFVPLDSLGIGLPEPSGTPTSSDAPASLDELAGPRRSPATGSASFRVLVAGVGNVLRGDDGFGVAVLQRLQERELPEDVELEEVGIGGIHLVQRLMGGGYQGLVILDAVDRDGEPGQLYELETEVPDPRDDDSGRLTEVDLHQTDPSRVLLMARALDALPPRVRIVGCQPGDTDLSESLSEPVQRAVEEAVERVLLLLDRWRHEYTHEERSRTGASVEGRTT